jgi:hypothetical protein
MPTILKWQAESFYQGLFRTEQVRDTLAATERVSLAAERISKAVETLPEEISAERKQTLEQFFAGVAEQRRALIEELDGDHSELRGTLTEFRDTVDATNDLAGSVTGAARAIESVAQRVMPDGAASEPKPGGGGLAKYEAVVAQTESAAERLNVLAQSIERLFLVPADPTGGPPPAQSAIAQAQHGAADVIDRAFWRVLVLVVVAPLAVLIAALAYRAFTRRALVLEQPRPASSARR